MSIRLTKQSILALGVFACTLVAILLVPILNAQIGGSERAAAPVAPAGEGPPAAADAKEPAKESVKEESETTALISLSGRAKDTAGAPVAGAKIYLVSTNRIDRQLGETTTDAGGNYSFRDFKRHCFSIRLGTNWQGSSELVEDFAAESSFGALVVKAAVL